MTKLTFTRANNTLRIEAADARQTLVLKTNAEGKICGGYFMAYGYGTRDMFSCWGPKFPRGVTLKQGKQLLRDFFKSQRKLRTR